MNGMNFWEVKEEHKLNLRFHDLKTSDPDLGISATIGNLEQASDVLLGLNYPVSNKIIIRANEEKKISIVSILPDKVETLPWAGHLGINLIDKVVAVVKITRLLCFLQIPVRRQRSGIVPFLKNIRTSQVSWLYIMDPLTEK